MTLIERRWEKTQAATGGPAEILFPPQRFQNRRSVDSSSVLDLQFIDMLRAYRRSGGIARRKEIDEAVCIHQETGHSITSRWLETGALFSFEWREQQWIPRFQLNPSMRHPHDGVLLVVRELRPVFDDWSLSTWFSQPNDMLHGETPADYILRDAAVVRQAARLARYIAAG